MNGSLVGQIIFCSSVPIPLLWKFSSRELNILSFFLDEIPTLAIFSVKFHQLYELIN